MYKNVAAKGRVFRINMRGRKSSRLEKKARAQTAEDQGKMCLRIQNEGSTIGRNTANRWMSSPAVALLKIRDKSQAVNQRLLVEDELLS
jgi:hypothetical protein